MKHCKILILILIAQISFSAQAKLEDIDAQVAMTEGPNPHRECFQKWSLIMAGQKLPADALNDLFNKFLSLCLKSESAFNLIEKFQKAGFKNPDKEVAALMRLDPDRQKAGLQRTGLHLGPGEEQAALTELGQLRAERIKYTSQSASLAQLAPQEPAGATK